MIDRGDIRQAIYVTAISGLHCQALVMVGSTPMTATVQNSKRANRSEEIDVSGRVTALSPLWLSTASSSACHGLLIITVITPLPAKQHETKYPENRSWRTRQLLTCRCVSA